MDQPLRVLIAEDNPLDVKLLLRELRQAGFSPDWKSVDTEIAFREALHADWDIILSDFMMPGFGGLCALELLKVSGFDIPFIIISGTIGEDEAVAAMKLGAADYLLKDRLGRLGLAVGHAIDQGRMRRERKRADLALRESEERFRGYFQLGLIGMAITSPELGYLEVNDELCKIMGYDRAELLGKKWSELTHPADLKTNLANYNKLIADEGDAFSMEKRFIRKDGRIVDATISVRCLRHADRSINFCMLLLQDITAKKCAEAALKESEKQLSLITNNIPAMISYVDRSLVYRFVNTAYEKRFNLPREQILGRTIKAMVGDDAWSGVEPFAIRALRGESVTFESRFPHMTLGKTLHYVVTYVPDQYADGTVKGLFVLVTDVTQLKQAEEALRKIEDQLHQSQKMDAIGQLAGGVAHDFNNQLSVILGYANILSQQIELPTLRGFANNICIAARRSADLTQKLLVFARKGQAQTAPVDLHKILDETIDMLERAVDKRITLQRIVNADSSVLMGNASQLQNALLNLGINARDAMPAGGTLTYRTDDLLLGRADCLAQFEGLLPGRYVKLTVTDTGTGMSDDVKQHLFEPFFTTKPIGKGTGLGLASVYGTVKQHGGVLSVESTLGYGTSFIIYLPLAEQVMPEFSADHTTPQKTKCLRVLVVEDEEILRTMLSYIISDFGHVVQQAEDGRSAVSYYQQHWQSIDLVFLDMVMPEMNGHDTFIALKKINPDVKAILVTGYSLNNDVQEILDDGVLEFIQKPFEVKLLQDTIARVTKS